MNEIVNIERLIGITNNMLSEHPETPALKIIQAGLESLINEFSQPNPDKNKISDIQNGLVRIYQEILEFKNTPFGKAMDELLIELNEY